MSRNFIRDKAATRKKREPKREKSVTSSVLSLSESVTYPQLLPVDAIKDRLGAIFLQGVENRGNCVGEPAARAVAAMLYGAAIQGNNLWVRPQQVYSMSDAQYATSDATSRTSWWDASLRPNYSAGEAWYAANTRESVRDDAIRNGLIPTGAVIERAGLAVTSSRGRYALGEDFARLFDPTLSEEEFEHAAEDWRASHLNVRALARVTINRSRASSGHAGVSVLFPGGRAEVLSSGPSSELTKKVIEEFAARFLANPAVVWVSESAQKVVNPDLSSRLRLSIDPSKNLPDVILIDNSCEEAEFLVIFVEVVVSDGPVTEQRKVALTEIARGAGFDTSDLAFVTAFQDRDSTAYRKLASNLAWGSFVWFASEPTCLAYLRDGESLPLGRLARV